MGRAIVNYTIKDGTGYVNIEADRFEQTITHLIVCKDDKIVGAFAWENVVSAYISERTEK